MIYPNPQPIETDELFIVNCRPSKTLDLMADVMLAGVRGAFVPRHHRTRRVGPHRTRLTEVVPLLAGLIFATRCIFEVDMTKLGIRVMHSPASNEENLIFASCFGHELWPLYEEAERLEALFEEEDRKASKREPEIEEPRPRLIRPKFKEGDQVLIRGGLLFGHVGVVTVGSVDGSTTVHIPRTSFPVKVRTDLLEMYLQPPTTDLASAIMAEVNPALRAGGRRGAVGG